MAHSVVLTGKHPYALLQRFSCRYVAIVAALLCNRQRLVQCSYRRTLLQSIHHCGIALHRIASHCIVSHRIALHRIASHRRFIAEHGGVGSPQVTPTWPQVTPTWPQVTPTWPQVTPTWLAWRAAAACAVHTLKILWTAQPAMSALR